jgi:hypothetical protein
MLNRRTAILAALAGLLLPRTVQAQERDPFPLMPRPNPSTSCAEPFLRTRQPVDYSEQFRSDLIVWAWNNRHLNSAYIALAPEVRGVPRIDGIAWVDGKPAGTFTLANIEFRIITPQPGMLPPDVLYAVMADCGGTLL